MTVDEFFRMVEKAGLENVLFDVSSGEFNYDDAAFAEALEDAQTAVSALMKFRTSGEEVEEDEDEFFYDSYSEGELDFEIE